MISSFYSRCIIKIALQQVLWYSVKRIRLCVTTKLEEANLFISSAVKMQIFLQKSNLWELFRKILRRREVQWSRAGKLDFHFDLKNKNKQFWKQQKVWQNTFAYNNIVFTFFAFMRTPSWYISNPIVRRGSYTLRGI